MSAVLITGGTGFIGSCLVDQLLRRGDEPWVLTRRVPNQAPERVRFVTSLDEIPNTQGFSAAVNLAGEPLAAERWNTQRKQQFINSRVETTRALVSCLERLDDPPNVLVSGSAIGYYGPRDDEICSEASEPNVCYSQTLCQQWEAAAASDRLPALRVCHLRIGIVLGLTGGPFPQLRLSQRFGVACILGSGKQWLSWIHIDDLVRAILFLCDTEKIRGPVNGTAPEPVNHQDFVTALATFHRTWLKIRLPDGLMRPLVGEMADELLLTGQRVVPQVLIDRGFHFHYADLPTALEQLLTQPA